MVEKEGNAERMENDYREPHANGRAFVTSATQDAESNRSFEGSVASLGDDRARGNGKERTEDNDLDKRDGDGTECTKGMPVDGIPPIAITSWITTICILC